MRPIHLLIVLLSILLFQPAMAYEKMMSESCTAIAKACKEAGFKREENGQKQFWKDCMKPVILGRKVSGVNIDLDTVKSCRQDKIKELKKKLSEFEMESSE